eukprot:scaffold37890_cov180-Skeletonema_marinoi.AAC.1
MSSADIQQNSCEQSVEPAQSLGQSFLWAREIRFIRRKGSCIQLIDSDRHLILPRQVSLA